MYIILGVETSSVRYVQQKYIYTFAIRVKDNDNLLRVFIETKKHVKNIERVHENTNLFLR